MSDEQAFTMLHDMVKEQGQQMRTGFSQVHNRLDHLVDTQNEFSVQLTKLHARVEHLHCVDIEGRPRPQTAGQWLISVGLDSVKYVIVGAVAALAVIAFHPDKPPDVVARTTNSSP